MSAEKRKQAEKRKANVRKKELRRYGYTGFETMSDRKINRLINRPSGVGKATEYAMNVGNYGPNSFIGQLEREGIRPPQALLDAVREKELKKQRRRDEEELQRRKRRDSSDDTISKKLGIPQIHIDFIRNEFSPRNYYEFEQSFEAMKQQLIDYTVSQIDYHNDINFTDEHGNFVSYVWGAKADTNNTVKSEMLRDIHALNGAGVVWLYNMMRNGTYFTDDINYDSDPEESDGKYTKHLYTAHQLLKEALDIPDDGVHDKYGDMMPDGYRHIFRSNNSPAFKLYRELFAAERSTSLNKERKIQEINDKAKKLPTLEFELYKQLKARMYDNVFEDYN